MCILAALPSASFFVVCLVPTLTFSLIAQQQNCFFLYSFFFLYIRYLAVCVSKEASTWMQIVRVVVAGGLLRSTDDLLQATHKQPRQQAATLGPIRYGWLIKSWDHIYASLFILLT